MLMISKRFSLWIICLLKIWNDKVVPKLRKIMNFGATLLIALTEEKNSATYLRFVVKCL